VALSRSSSGYFLGAAMLLILPWDQSLHQTRGDSGDTGSGAQLGAAFRAADVNTYFRLVNSGTSYRLHRVVGGSPTLLAPATDDIIPASGDRIRIELDGASIVCFINDAQVFEVTDNLNATETRHGFFNNGTAADNSIRAVKITA